MKNYKFWIVLTAVFLAAGFAFALFHHHEDGQLHSDCVFCRFAQQIVCCFGLIPAVFIVAISEARRFGPVFRQNFNSLLLAAKIRDRAPPSFS